MDYAVADVNFNRWSNPTELGQIVEQMRDELG